ncbi:hypothetical protein [Rhizobium sp. ARZ01]|uniref:hypothetical protein n=1 Tax=Rhizobium sp. ARZ01 TaxID=2769313 RepID=UPI001FEF21F4|nr:hypothetical protein [Rhizobium sp. ARZ01]
MGDVAWRHAVGIEREDTANNLCLAWIDLAQALDTITVRIALLGEHVAVGEAGGCLTFLDSHLHAFARAVADLLNQFMAERGTQRHLEVGHRRAGMDGPDIGVAIAKFLEDLRAVLGMCFIEGPEGLSIELLERDEKYR